MVENMSNVHNAQMEKIIKLVTELKDGNKSKGKEERRKIIDYTSDDNEYY